jgi:Asp-tRNA(Asn)/Glu-tRNA(Gln) amidotransferase A subunit family amidase
MTQLNQLGQRDGSAVSGHKIAATRVIPGVAEAVRGITSGALTSEILLMQCLDAIQTHEEDLGAWAYYNADAALDNARALDRATPSGPLHGIPFGLKDTIDVAAWPTGYGTKIYDGYISPRDAGCVALLKEAGALCLGKTVSTELGHVFPGKTRNPRDLQRTPGGSSSGSAAAVAAGMVPFALGTQTTGSVIRPAAFCGVVGYKPTFGDVTTSGVFANSASFDTVGVICRAVEDLPLIRAALVRNPVVAIMPPDIKGLRIGILREVNHGVADPWMNALLDDFVETLSADGADVSEIRLPVGFDRVRDLHRSISGFEFTRALSWERLNRNADLSAVLREGRMKDGLDLSIDSYHIALRELQGLQEAFGMLMANFDALVTPSARGEALLGLGSTGDPVFNTAFSALHVPVLTLPLFSGPSGAPVGVQIVGRRGEDERLFAVSQAIETLFQLR